MTVFKINVDGSYQGQDLFLSAVDYQGVAIATSATGSPPAQDANGFWYASDNLDVSGGGLRVITVKARNAAGDVANSGVDYTVDNLGAIQAPQSNAGFDAKLDQIITDGAKEQTVSDGFTAAAKETTLVTRFDTVDAANGAIAANTDKIPYIPRAPEPVLDGEAVEWALVTFTGKDNINVEYRKVS